MFCILVIFFGGFNANAEGPELEDILVNTQKVVYDSLSPSSQREIKDFYCSLKKSSVHKKHHFGYMKKDFVEFLRRVDDFLNSEINQQVKVKKAYIIGIANLEDESSYIINIRHLKVFIPKSRSALNNTLVKIGFYRLCKSNMGLGKIQSFFGDLLHFPHHLMCHWIIREKLQQEPLHMPEILSPTPVPQKSPSASIFPSDVSGDFLSTTSIEETLTVPPDFRQDIDFSFDFEQNPDSLFGDSYNIDNFDFFD